MIQQRSIVVSILLSFVTCGIYGIYWFYTLTDDTNKLSGDTSLSPGLSILLNIITCGIYGIYWAYKMGKNVQKAQMNKNLPADDKSIVYLLLAIFGLSIITYCLIQNDLNSMAN